MGPSIQIAKILGIPIKLHWTFVFLIPLGMYLMEMPNFGSENLLFFSVLFILISICVILHEYGHALAAKYYGIKTDDIILSPLFGVARIQKLPDSPLGEFIVAVAGPAVNILIGIIFFIYLQIVNPEFLSIFGYEIYHSLFSEGKRVAQLPDGFSKINLAIAILILVNLGLVVFNLIPAFPMDGGRMFRAILHSFTDKLTATKVATFLGKFISILIILLSIRYHQYGIALIGVFIYYMAASEFRMVKGEAFRNQFHIGDMMKTEFTRLDSFTTRKQIEYLLYRSHEKNYLVFDQENNLKGILIKDKIIEWLDSENYSFENEIDNYLIMDFPTLNENMITDEALEIMRTSNIRFLPIEKENEIIGVLSRSVIYEFMELKKRIRY